MKKKTLLVLFAIATTCSVVAQPSSPYVEAGSLIINNSGFKPTSIRTTPLTRPTPMHTHNNAINHTFPTRFVVSKADVMGGPKTWAEANSLTMASNSAVSGGIVSVIPTGCNSYFEPDAPLGQWRLPTQREMILIGLTKLELLAQAQGMSALTGMYWTATQSTATLGWSYSFSLYVMYPRAKTEAYLIRCVRDL